MRFAQATPYVVAVAVILFILGLKQMLDPVVEQENSPLLFLDAAVMVSAWFGNWRAGLVTLLLAAVATFFLGPTDEPGWKAVAVVRAFFFGIEGGLILIFVAALHRAREKAERSRRETAATIAQREEADRSLQSSRARFRRLVEANIIGVFFCEEDGRVFEANQSFLSLLGYDEEDVRQGRLNVAEITPREFIDVTMAATVELASEGRCQPYEKELIRKDGTRLPVLIGSALLSDSEGQTVSFALDLSEQKATESELQQAKDEAERANRLKSDFLANISHELRTPMNAILGMTQLALDEKLSLTVREYLETAYDSGRSLLSLVNEILDFSKMEAGRFELEMAPFRLRETLDESFRSLALQATEKDLELSADVAWDVPDELIGDAHRLRQVVVNLVGNGIKFTTQGKVSLDVAVASKTSDEIVLHFTVADTGIGISEEDQQRIFAPFTQVDTSTTRRYGGTGLGLAIASELIRMHGGRLELHSRVGHGSRFEFDARFGLPEPGPGDALPAISVDDLRDMPVLVVDAHDDHRHWLEETLGQRGMQPTLAASGREALRIMRSAAEAASNPPSQLNAERDGSDPQAETDRATSSAPTASDKAASSFQLVLIDTMMPEMDGFELAEHIRRDPQLCGAAIVMLSANGQPGDLEKCQALHIGRCVDKPLDEAALLDAVLHALTLPSPPLPHGRLSPETRSCLPLRVLLAEDTPANCYVVKAILQKRGHHVTVAADGKQAVEATRQQVFDAVLMDVQMPEMDGLLATATIRADEQRSGSPPVPIIAMTAHAMKGDRHRCLAAGMNAYLAKPIDAHKLIELLESVTSPREDSATETQRSALAGDYSTGQSSQIDPQWVPASDESRASAEQSAADPRADGSLPKALPPDRNRLESTGAPADKDCAAPSAAEADVPKAGRPELPKQEDAVTAKADSVSLDDAPLEIPDRVQMDLDKALARLANNRALLSDMFGFYKEDAPQLLEAIRQGAEQQDRESAARAAHSLKGLSSSFDAHDNVEAAARIEKLAHAGSFDAILMLIDGMTVLTEKLIQQIEAELRP